MQKGSTIFEDHGLTEEGWVAFGIRRIWNLKRAVSQGAADIQLIKATEIRETLSEGFPKGWFPLTLVAKNSRKDWLG